MSAVYDLHFSIDFPIAGFLLKPFQFDTMLNLIESLLAMPAVDAQNRG
jgi:hypothetical protein